MQETFQYGESLIHYRVTGKGQPVVLLHGFGEDGHIWDEQVAHLSEHCMVIVPDLPGSGGSTLLREATSVRHELKPGQTHDSGFTPPKTEAFITINHYADCIHRLLQQLTISQCIMLGHSMGGYITLAFAEKYPALLKAIGLVNSTAFADSDEKKEIRQKAIDTIGKYGAAAFLKTTIPSLFGKSFKQEHPEKVDALIRSGEKFSATALQQYYRAMMLRPDRTAVLKSNDLPVLFVMGTEDNAAPMTDVLQQVSLPAKSYIYILENVGHMSMWEAAAQLNRLLLVFINQ
jgi:pimeloyl-ACP methyl ester carboxylesterase